MAENTINVSRQFARRALFQHAFRKVSRVPKVEPGTTGEEAVLFAISLTSRQNRRAYAREAAKAEFVAARRRAREATQDSDSRG